MLFKFDCAVAKIAFLNLSLLLISNSIRGPDCRTQLLKNGFCCALALQRVSQTVESGNRLRRIAFGYRFAHFEHDFDQDTWVSGFEIRPDVRKIVHHANLNVVIPEPGKTVDWKTLQTKGERKEDHDFTIKSIHVGVPGRYAFQTAKGVAGP